MIYVSKFRTNDLNPSKGKQIEFNSGVSRDFFEFSEDSYHVDFECHSLEDSSIEKHIHVYLKLSPKRGDYKIYQNEDGEQDLKDFFLETLHLSEEKNNDDYFAIKKKNQEQYILYFVPKESLFDDFFQISKGHEIYTDNETKTKFGELSWQQIYYGAPGTGKSHTIKKITKGENVVRTTFHPDTDYSSFVGCYKPTMKNIAIKEDTLSSIELKKKLFEIKLDGETYPCQRFGAEYWNSLEILEHREIKEIIEDCGFTESMAREVEKGVAVGKNLSENKEEKIVYEFVSQSFLNAYINAWKLYARAENIENIEKQYLIIEEINRGNCAQIFGDLFQLLDRNKYGFSDYPIQADADMQKHLKKAFSEVKIDFKDAINSMCKDEGEDIDFVSKVLNGDILLLPNNLYIWATMNTSDQSLFPIDSAFKRRWDWKYVPIFNANRNWVIKTNGNYYEWWTFIDKINKIIDSVTHSEDKKLGYFFCKAQNHRISAETFVGKVIFYLWNDVFKDYEFEHEIFNDEDNTKLSFDKFYDVDFSGNSIIQEDKVELFLKNLKLEPIPDYQEDEEDDSSEIQTGKGLWVRYNGELIREKSNIETFIKTLEKIGLDKVMDAGLMLTTFPLVSKGTPDSNMLEKYPKDIRYVNGYNILTKYDNSRKLEYLSRLKKSLNLDLEMSIES